MVTFFPFYFRVALLKQNSSQKGTLTIEGSLKNLVQSRHEGSWSEFLGLKGSDCRETEPTDCADYQKLHQGNSSEKPKIG